MNNYETDLFGDSIKKPYEIEITPVSVIDLKPQRIRQNKNHDKKSSRQEYSPFPQEIASLCFEYFMRDSSLVFDPFAGWGERGQAANSHKRNYIGYDLSPDAILKAKEKGVNNILANSMNAEIPNHDGLVTCPPYWDLEIYNGNGIDKSSSWVEFCDKLQTIFTRCWDKASSGSVYCIMVGEWRSNHKFHDLEGVTRRIMHDLGAEIFDQIIVSRKNTSKIKIMLPQAKRLGYTVRVHESLLVFKKK
jgi:hypothetical protein